MPDKPITVAVYQVGHTFVYHTSSDDAPKLHCLSCGTYIIGGHKPLDFGDYTIEELAIMLRSDCLHRSSQMFHEYSASISR